MEDPLRNIEPVQLGVKQMCQASVELPSITDDTGCGLCLSVYQSCLMRGQTQTHTVIQGHPRMVIDIHTHVHCFNSHYFSEPELDSCRDGNRTEPEPNEPN